MCKTSGTIIGSMCSCGCDNESSKFLIFDCEGISDGTGCPQLSLSDIAIEFDSIRKYQTTIKPNLSLTAESDIIAFKSNIPVKRFSDLKLNHVFKFEFSVNSLERVNNDYIFSYSLLLRSFIAPLHSLSEFELEFAGYEKIVGNSTYSNKNFAISPIFENKLLINNKKMMINSCSEVDELEFIEKITLEGVDISLNLKLFLEAMIHDSVEHTKEHIVVQSIDANISKNLFGCMFYDFIAEEEYLSTTSESTFFNIAFFGLNQYLSEGTFVFENLEQPVHFYNDKKSVAEINMLEIYTK